VIVLLAAGCRRDPPPPASAPATTAPATTAGGSGSTKAGAENAGSTGSSTNPASKAPTSGAVAAESKPAAPEAPPKPVGTFETSADGGTRTTINGLDIEVAADVPQRPKDAPAVVNGDNQVVITLRGWPIVARDGRLYVGGKDFGAAPAGSRVRVAKDGVYVDGELRGPLP
jgi:hypothetical protein